MPVLGILLGIVGLGFVCWLIFSLTVYALPFVVGLTIGLAALHGGAGVIGAFGVGLFAGGLTLVLGQIAFASVRAPLARIAIGCLYVVPAAIAGYNAALGLAQFGVPSHGWREVFAVSGAVLIGATAWARLTLQVASPCVECTASHPAPLPLAVATKGQ
jgi:hypothetical protein